MSDQESKKILESIDKALPKMSDFDKGYFLGIAEATAKKEADKATEKVG